MRCYLTCFQVSGTCDLAMMVFTRSLKGFLMEPDEALTARGRIRSCPCALLGFILSSTAFTTWWLVSRKSKSVRRSLTRHRNSVYMCLVSESSVLVDNQIFCDICKYSFKISATWLCSLMTLSFSLRTIKSSGTRFLVCINGRKDFQNSLGFPARELHTWSKWRMMDLRCKATTRFLWNL